MRGKQRVRGERKEWRAESTGAGKGEKTGYVTRNEEKIIPQKKL